VRNGKNAITVTVVSSKHGFLEVLFFILFGSASLSAGSLAIQGSVGTLFDSNIEHLSIVDFLTMGKRYGFFIRNSAGFDYSFGNSETVSTGMFLFSETGLDVPEKSRLQEMVSLSWRPTIRGDLDLDITMLAHHAAENYLRLRNMFLDFFLMADLFWDITHLHALSGAMRGGYFIGFDEEMQYLTGPALGLEAGYWYYPTKRADYLKSGVGIEGYFFRPEELSSCTETLTVHNRSLKVYLLFEGKAVLSPIFFKGNLRYAYLVWLESDRLNAWHKRRQEHIPSLSAQISWHISEHFDLAVIYTYRYIFSNFGRDPNDYVNYTMDRHTLLLEFTARYEGKTP